MIFELTEELSDAILSAMENQDSDFAVEASSGSLVQLSKNIVIDEDNYYGLPDWTSKDGFQIRENFVKEVHAPVAREELQQVLHSGRGVFKNFRNILKSYPEIDKRWHIFKYRIMSARVNEWYNSLREIWGLETLNQYSETDEDLVRDDFSFREYVSSEDKKSILLNITPDIFDDGEMPSEVKMALCELYKNQFENHDSASQIGFVCHSLSDDFAGCITATSLLENQEKILTITSLFVPEEFRGLGIATELLVLFVEKVRSLGKKWILIPHKFLPEVLEPLLIRTGFSKESSGNYYILGV